MITYTLKELVDSLKNESTSKYNTLVADKALEVAQKLEEAGLISVSRGIIDKLSFEERIHKASTNYVEISLDAIRDFLNKKIRTIPIPINSNKKLMTKIEYEDSRNEVSRRLNTFWSGFPSQMPQMLISPEQCFCTIVKSDYIVEYIKVSTGSNHTISHFSYREINIRAYDKIPPNNVLDAVIEAKKSNLFDVINVGKVEQENIKVIAIKDPIVVGLIKNRRFFIAQWDNDIPLDEIV